MKGLIKACSGGSAMCPERMENDKIAQRFYVGESAGSQSVGRLQK